MLRFLFTAVVAILAVEVVFAENYPQFRGASHNATSETALPTAWSVDDGQSSNIRWKIRLEGEGWSQPIVWEDRLYFSAAIPADPKDEDRVGPEAHNGGYGRDRNDLVNVTFDYVLICVDSRTGEQIWRTTVKTGKPPIPRHSTNTYATETPVTDGKQIYVSFGMNGVYCLDMDGSVVWTKDLGAYQTRGDWGTSSSPTLFEDKLFVQFDNDEASALIALGTKSGEEIWRVKREERTQYSSPIVWQNSLRAELIVGGMVYRSHDPNTGEELWRLDMNKGRSSATPIAVGDRLFVGNEFRNRGGSDDGGGRLYAVLPGGSGDITPPGSETSGEYVAWRMDDSDIQMASPTICNGHIYFFQRRGGIVNCVNAESGSLAYRRRVQGARAFWASPWTDGVHVFALDSDGNTHVLRGGEDYEIVSVNRLGEQSWGTPAVANGAIFLRTVDHLYCIRAD